MISAGLEEPIVYEKIVHDEPQAFIEVLPTEPLESLEPSEPTNVQSNCSDVNADSDVELDFHGFPQNGDNMILSINSLLNYQTWQKYNYLNYKCDWTSNDTKIPPAGKRSHYQMLEADSTFDCDPNWIPAPQSVPKRSRRRR